MGIYKKDYLKLSDSEKEIVQTYHELTPKYSSKFEEITGTSNWERRFKILELVERNPFILNTKSYFPNHYLNDVNLKLDNLIFQEKLEKFKGLVDNNQTTERQILNFIREEEAHFIIGSYLKSYTIFGHHDRYIFQEFQLPPSYKADFVIVGKNSDGYHFVFVEVENPYGNITIDNGSFGVTIRKGIDQLSDWKHWIDKNFSSLRIQFNQFKNPNKDLPSEFYEFDSSRMNYVVIAGRRNDFNEKTYRLARESRKNGFTVIHYDNLIDQSDNLLKDCAY